jgi:serpin B
MGMGDVFDASTADFGRMAPGLNICISEILHRAVMKVDEAGTVAAAVTAVCMTKSCAPRAPLPKKVKIDRPFIFVVYDRNKKVILFAAKVETVPALADAGDAAPDAASMHSASAGDKRKMVHDHNLGLGAE